MMTTRGKRIGYAKRVRARSPFGTRLWAWDCRPFGLGRVAAPALATRVEIARDTTLDLVSGEVRLATAAARAA